MDKVFVCEPYIGEEEVNIVIDCLKKKEISGSFGEYIEKFEDSFSSYCNAKYGVSTTNGTTALHLALASLDIKEGDEVIVSNITNIATVFAIIYVGAKPVLVDSEKETWNIDVSKIEEKITDKTKVILPVHIYGHPVDMDPLIDIAKKYNLKVIEDAAEAHGAEYKGRKTGTLGDIGCFSFYANKIVTTGEGGMIVTTDEKIAKKAKLLRNLSFSKERRFLHEYIGFNYRMSNIHAAIGYAQMEKIDDTLSKKIAIAKKYEEELKDLKGLRLPIERSWAKNVYWMYTIIVEDDFGITKDVLREELNGYNVETRDFFTGMHEQPAFLKKGLFKGENYPVSEYLSKRGLYLPSGANLTDEQIKYICNSIKEIQKKHLF